jgi:hypothetical protein
MPGANSRADPREPTTPDASNGAASGPKYAAKCAAVANLQRLFFEEVGRSGDANAAAAAALLRLAEESRPTGELSPRHLGAGGGQRDPGRTTNLPRELEEDLVVREAEESQTGDRCCRA